MGKAKRRDDWSLGFSFDAETEAAVVVPVDVPGVDSEPSTDALLAECVPIDDAPFVFDGQPFGAPDAPPRLPTDADPSKEPDALSTNTRVCVDDADGVAPTVMAAGMGDAKMSQSFLGDDQTGTRRFDIGGARRMVVPVDEPAPTVMAGGIGSVNTGQYSDAVLTGSQADVVTGKPPYRVPLVSETRVRPPNGLTAISTFTGCGGSDLGLMMAGYDVLWGNEFVPAAQETFSANHPDVPLDCRDIRTVTGADIRNVIGDIDLDLFVGSPPCASFSTAGKTSKGWGEVRKYSDVEQRTDDLFEQYIRLVDELRPRAFVAENVSGMVKGVAVGFFNEYVAKMRKIRDAAGPLYHVQAKLLDAQYLGVPQTRVRLIFVGIRKDVGRPAWPKKLPYRYSVRDAIPWIASGAAFTGRSGGEPVVRSADDAPMDTITAQGVQGRAVRGTCAAGIIEPVETRKIGSNEVVADNVAPSLDGYAIGTEWDKMQPGETSEKFFNLVRPLEDAPCPTITQTGGNVGAAGVAHPTERRKFTIAELRRICGFPDDFVLTGTYGQAWERLGRAVPPPMMHAISAALVPVLKGGR